ncbi:hypothetical protein MG293_007344 [Ovis ammon polii]|uniref:Transmembrane protein n=1 Tax=Ovis ammon polii TaxID=230172 RepID=A0AAD4UDB9_OVIAM|nr:hypothetical protein MG293_007344 [Ovis ammon polii]
MRGGGRGCRAELWGFSFPVERLGRTRCSRAGQCTRGAQSVRLPSFLSPFFRSTFLHPIPFSSCTSRRLPDFPLSLSLSLAYWVPFSLAIYSGLILCAKSLLLGCRRMRLRDLWRCSRRRGAAHPFFNLRLGPQRASELVSAEQ